jgi:hypothetical protein
MVSLVLADALMAHAAQCQLFPAGALEEMDANPLGKQLQGLGMSH